MGILACLLVILPMTISIAWAMEMVVGFISSLALLYRLLHQLSSLLASLRSSRTLSSAQFGAFIKASSSCWTAERACGEVRLREG
jgi:hypothetical protein